MDTTRERESTPRAGPAKDRPRDVSAVAGEITSAGARKGRTADRGSAREYADQAWTAGADNVERLGRARARGGRPDRQGNCRRRPAFIHFGPPTPFRARHRPCASAASRRWSRAFSDFRTAPAGRARVRRVGGWPALHSRASLKKFEPARPSADRSSGHVDVSFEPFDPRYFVRPAGAVHHAGAQGKPTGARPKYRRR